MLNFLKPTRHPLNTFTRISNFHKQKSENGNTNQITSKNKVFVESLNNQKKY